jgi:hypothetical protein
MVRELFLFLCIGDLMGPRTSASASRFANGSLDSCEELETDSAKLSKRILLLILLLRVTY